MAHLRELPRRLTLFVADLRRRRVFRVVVLYLAGGWVAIEVAETLVPLLMLPGWIARAVAVTVLVGFPVALVLGWAYDVTSVGIERTGRAEAEGSDVGAAAGVEGDTQAGAASSPLPVGPAAVPERSGLPERAALPEADALALAEARAAVRGRDPASLREAVTGLEDLLERVPDLAAARAELAVASALLGDAGVIPLRQALARAKAEATDAVRLDPGLGRAHAALGFAATLDWEWEEAERSFRRALDVAPDDADTRHWYSIHRTAVGQLGEALTEIARATEIAPLEPRYQAAAAGLRYYARQPERAIDLARSALEMDDGSTFARLLLALAHESRGAFGEARAALRELMTRGSGSDPLLLAALGHVCATEGQEREARRILETLRGRGGGAEPSPFCLAALEAAVGEPDAGFVSLDRAVAAHDGWLLSLRVHPWADPLRADPRFDAVLRTIGLDAAEPGEAAVSA